LGVRKPTLVPAGDADEFVCRTRVQVRASLLRTSLRSIEKFPWRVEAHRVIHPARTASEALFSLRKRAVPFGRRQHPLKQFCEVLVSDKAQIQVGDQSFECGVITGTENERALDIAQLRAKTGLVTLDPAFMNTASTKSSITFIDGDAGILRYRGYPIEQLAEHSTFVETAYLLIYGHLPSKVELE